MTTTVHTEWILHASALLAALVAMFAFSRKAYKRANRLAEAVDVIFGIAEQFKPNHGTSLRDVIDRIDSRTVVLQAVQRAVLQVHEYAITETDNKGNLVWANRTYLSLVRLTLEDVRGRGWIQVIHEEDRTRIVQQWQHAVEDGRDTELTFCLVGGEAPHPVHARCMALRDNTGLIHGWIAVIHRITCDDRSDPRCVSCKHRR